MKKMKTIIILAVVASCATASANAAVVAAWDFVSSDSTAAPAGWTTWGTSSITNVESSSVVGGADVNAYGRSGSDQEHIADVTIDPADFQGEDVLDIWMGSDRSRDGEQFWNSSMKQDDWRIYFSGGSTNAVELFDLSTDIAETHNLLTVRPDIVTELTGIWQDWKDSLP